LLCLVDWGFEKVKEGAFLMRQKARVLLASFVLVLLPLLMGAAGPDARGYPTEKYALEIDGVLMGWVDSVSGGNAVADVVTEKPGSDSVQRKHIGNVKYEEITVTVGADMSKQFYQWIQNSFDRKYTRKSGSIIAADYNYKETSRLSFTNAMITEVSMPALDAASKDAAKMTIKFMPEVTQRKKGSGNTVNLARDQKMWLPANFRLRIDGLDEATSRVNKIEAITIKQTVVAPAVGDTRDYQQEATMVEVPNLVITLDEPDAWSLYDWQDDFVIKGNNGQEKEKGGTLEYLAPDLKETLFTLKFGHLGIFKIAPDKMEAGSESIRRVKAEMYCEEVRFNFQGQ
jgi:phage tail-like protein